MKLIIIFFSIIIVSTNAVATETKIFFDKYEIPGQVSRNYYIKESVKTVDNEEKHIIQVNTYRTVISNDGTTTYKSKFRLDCKNKKYALIELWSSGFGYNKSFIDGKWRDSSEYPDTQALTKAICMEAK